jgi:hypothetical protein
MYICIYLLHTLVPDLLWYAHFDRVDHLARRHDHARDVPPRRFDAGRHLSLTGEDSIDCLPVMLCLYEIFRVMCSRCMGESLKALRTFFWRPNWERILPQATTRGCCRYVFMVNVKRNKSKHRSRTYSNTLDLTLMFICVYRAPPVAECQCPDATSEGIRRGKSFHNGGYRQCLEDRMRSLLGLVCG